MPDLADPPFTCSACRFWSMHPLAPRQGRCRRHAPTGRPTAAGLDWPVTDAEEWCGEGVGVSRPQLVARREAEEAARASCEALASFDDDAPQAA